MGKAGTGRGFAGPLGSPTGVWYDEGQGPLSRSLVVSFVSVAITMAPAHVSSHLEPISTLGRAKGRGGKAVTTEAERAAVQTGFSEGVVLPSLAYPPSTRRADSQS